MKISQRLVLIISLLILLVNSALAQRKEPELLKIINSKSSSYNDKKGALDEITDLYAYTADSVNKYAKLGVELSTKKGDELWMAMMLYKLGISTMNMGDFEKSIGYLDQAAVYAKKHKKIKLLGNLARGKGLALYSLQKFDLAAKELVNAVSFYEQAGLLTNIPTCYSIIGSIHMDVKNFEEGVVFNLKALNLLLKLRADTTKKYTEGELEQFETNYVDFNGNLASCYHNLKKYKLAAYYFDNALSKGENGKNIWGHVIMLANASGTYFELGNKKKADSLVRRSYALAKKMGLKLQEANALSFIGRFSDNKAEVDASFSKSAQIARSVGDFDLLSSIYKYWAAKAEGFKDYPKALEKFKRHTSLEDSLVTVEQLTKIADLESTFKLKEADVKLKTSELEGEKKQNLSRWLATIVVLVIIVALIVFFYYLKTTRLNTALAQKTELLKELNDFKSRVFSIIGHDVSGAISSMSAIIYILKQEGPKIGDYDSLLDSLMGLKENASEMLNGLFIWGTAEMSQQKKELLTLPDGIERSINISDNLATAKNLKLYVKNEKPYLVYANREYLEFIVRNLLSNAIKFSAIGQDIIMEISKVGNEVIIAVSNRGEAFDPSALANIFSDSVDSKLGSSGERGKGHGLMLCKRIADLEGFKLKVQYADDTLTKLALVIPVDDSQINASLG